MCGHRQTEGRLCDRSSRTISSRLGGESRRKSDLLRTAFWMSSLQNCEKIQAELPSLQSFVVAAFTKKHRENEPGVFGKQKPVLSLLMWSLFVFLQGSRYLSIK